MYIKIHVLKSDTNILDYFGLKFSNITTDISLQTLGRSLVDIKMKNLIRSFVCRFEKEPFVRSFVDFNNNHMFWFVRIFF